MSDTRNATPAEELERRFMDPCRPKSEASHWAVREIDKQRAQIERLQKEADLTREALGGWALVPPDGGADPTHERVAAVVAEVEKLRADLATQQGCCDGAAAQDAHIRKEREEHRAEVERHRAENERLRAVLSSIRIDGPDLEGLVWVSFVSQGLAARAHVVVGDENRMASRVALRFKELRRAALEGKP